MSAVEVTGPAVRVDAGSRPGRAVDVVLPVTGTFDLAASMRAAAAARARPRTARVTLDLRHARIEDAALAAFVREVAGRAVKLAGLSGHHERLLRYLEQGGATAKET